MVPHADGGFEPATGLDRADQWLDRIWLPSTDGGAFNPEVHICLERGTGVWAEDVDGAEYLDANAGLWHLSLGYAPTPALDAAAAAGEQLGGSSLLRRAHPWALELVATLSSHLQLPDPVLFFATSGSEAVDAALRIAFAYHDDPDRRVVAFISGGYHGVSLGPLSLSASSRYRNGSPQVLETVALPSVSEWHANTEDTTARVAHVFETHGHRIAAAIVECIQCVGGVEVVPNEYLGLVSRLAREAGCVLIDDEVSTGVFRTGTFIAVNSTPMSPHVVVLGKGLTAGVSALSVVAVEDRVAAAVRGRASTNRIPGSTLAGGPPACAAAVATLRILEAGAASRTETAAVLEAGLATMSELPHVEAVTGRGHARGVRLASHPAFHDAEFLKRATRLGRDHQLLLHPLSSGVIPVMPALNISHEEVGTLLERLRKVIVDLGRLTAPSP